MHMLMHWYLIKKKKKAFERTVIVFEMSIKLNDILPILAFLQLRISCVLSAVVLMGFEYDEGAASSTRMALQYLSSLEILNRVVANEF